MFLAGSNLRNKTEEEIFFQDFKKFSMDEVTVGVGQITSLNAEELKSIGLRMKPVMEQFRQRENVQMLFFMLTDISKESTTLLYAGEGVESLLETAFELTAADGSMELSGVVSRKKQLVPALIQALQQG